MQLASVQRSRWGFIEDESILDPRVWVLMGDASAVHALTLLADGRDAEIFAWSEGRVLRLMRATGCEGDIEREVLAMSAARRAGAPVPCLYGEVTVGERAGLLMERLDPVDMLKRLGSSPWLVGTVGRTLGGVHARLHRIAAPVDLPSVVDIALGRLEKSELAPAIKDELKSELKELPDGDRLLHGDFNPANLLRRVGSNAYVVSDWVGAGRGHPAADIAQTTVMIRGGAVPSHTPAIFRLGAPIGRRLLRASYLNAYGEELELDMALVSRWEAVWKAIREAEPVDALMTSSQG